MHLDMAFSLVLLVCMMSMLNVLGVFLSLRFIRLLREIKGALTSPLQRLIDFLTNRK